MHGTEVHPIELNHLGRRKRVLERTHSFRHLQIRDPVMQPLADNSLIPPLTGWWYVGRWWNVLADSLKHLTGETGRSPVRHNNPSTGSADAHEFSRRQFGTRREHRSEHAHDYIKDDPTDNHILACAREGQADLIVSGDKHLRRIKVYEGIPIIRPIDFLHTLAGYPLE
jgi:hypothetical protein